MLSDFQSAVKLADSANLIDAEDTAIIFYDKNRLQTILESVSSSFGDGMQSVAIKTCPIPSVLRLIVEHGFALEAASIEEVRLAKSARVGAKYIIFDSPVKTQLEIVEVSLDANILLNCNSLEELDRIPDTICGDVGLRINPMAELENADQFNVSTPNSKFGVPIINEDDILKAFTEHRWLNALHMHIGSGLGEIESHINAVRQLTDLAEKINGRRSKLGWPEIAILDIGGGFKSHRSTEDNVALISSYTNALGQIDGLFENFRISTEFGQLIHGPNGFVLTQVEYVRQIDNTQQVFIHVGADLFTRNVYSELGNKLDFFALTQENEVISDEKKPSHLVGPLCFAGDELGGEIALPSVKSQDRLIISNGVSNTYGLWSRHCSRDMPKVLIYDLERAKIELAEQRKRVW